MNKPFAFLTTVILIIIVTIVGFPLDMMPPDAALYGSISKTMYLNDDFINLYSMGKDWLDKPHLPFWLTALSFKIFGVSNFSYKIPGVLIFLFGVWATYKFTKETYTRETAILASVILLTSLHSVISNFDVRAEPYLTGFIIGSMYWFYKYIQNKNWKDLVIACFLCALAIMTKGIFALIPLVAAIGGHFLVKRNWKEMLNPMWLISFVLIAIFITPELYALYQQFDIHPEKVIFGNTDVSGIKFFLWDSQFGRFFNTGPIKGNGDVFYFIHTILWAFLPWSILFYIATFLKIKRNFKIVQSKEEFYSIFGALASILVFSLSKFQLAHYTNIVFPFMAVITADFVIKLKDKYVKLQKTFVITQWILISISLVAIVLISILMKPNFNSLLIIILLISVIALYIIMKQENEKVKRLFYFSAIAFSFLYGFMLTHFYPTLLQYQGGVHAARYLNNSKAETVYLLDNNSHNFGFEFYLNTPLKRVAPEGIENFKGKTFYANKKDLEYIKNQKLAYTIIQVFDDYRITKLKGRFVNKKSRQKTLGKKYIITLN